nr:hypothetical protein [Pseudomonas sp.]
SIGMLLLVASMMVPIGPALFVTLMPAVTVMTLNACRSIEQGIVVQPLRLWRLLGEPGMARKLLGMGALYMGTVLVAGFLAFLPFMADLAAATEQVTETTGMDPLLDAMRTPMMIFGALYLLIAALFWHAPVLVAWHQLSLRKALFFSGVACWRNKGAFVVYGLVWGSLVLAVEVLAALLQGAGLPPTLVGLIQMPLSFVLAAGLYCSFYPTYTYVFGDYASQ